MRPARVEDPLRAPPGYSWKSGLRCPTCSSSSRQELLTTKTLDKRREQGSPKETMQAFDQLKKALMSVPALGLPDRFLKYQDVEIVVTNIVNLASFLSGSMREPVIHDCLEAIEATYSSCPDLKDTLLRILRPGPPMEAAVSSVEGMLEIPDNGRVKSKLTTKRNGQTGDVPSVKEEPPASSSD
ncbi:hypothetical protein DUI87_23728 [Hirundo rustica rustica]|uniref:Uncharacterized protein n=1 Tax=Hirundo rustica rustica TaxID=333673 RepID=A0A3M0JXT2_HIRRU|nr:hypothetical protein DUI87_23728 [Hirundo rustica rustica]